MLIISIDGGGVRGVIPIRLLQRLQVAYPALLHNTGCFAGASTGAVITLALASRTALAPLLDSYFALAGSVFRRTFLSRLAVWSPVFRARYSAARLEAACGHVFCDRTMAALRHSVVIPIFDANQGCPVCFSNIPKAPRVVRSGLLKDIACAACAAPTYFASKNGLVDGGIWANDPAMLALATCLSAGADIRSIRLLSISTGRLSPVTMPPLADWGYVQWAPRLVSMLMDGCMDASSHACSQVLGDRYFRLTYNIPSAWSLDSSSRMPEMLDFADSMPVGDVCTWLSSSCRF